MIGIPELENFTKAEAYNLEAEKSIIGIMLLETKYIMPISEELNGNEFYNGIMKGIYKQLMQIYRTNPNEYDLIKIVDVFSAVMKKDKAEIKRFFAECMALVPSTRNWNSYVKIVKNNYIIREAERIFTEKQREMTFETASEILQDISLEFSKLTQVTEKQSLIDLADYVVDYYQQLFDKKSVNLVDLGISGLDNILGGVERDSLTIIAARPSTGKSAFAVEIVKGLMKQGKSVALYSLEMSKQQICNRLFANYTQVPHDNLKRHNVDEFSEKIANAAAIFAGNKNKVLINDMSNLKVSQIRNEFSTKKVDVIIVDHLGLVNSEEYHRDLRESITEITRNLKILAKDIDTPIIALCQLNRAVETRQSSKPQLSDLRESGSIEQDANNVIFLFKTDREDEDSNIGIFVAKNRNGSTGTCVKAFNRETQTFSTNFIPYENEPKNARKKNENVDFR